MKNLNHSTLYVAPLLDSVEVAVEEGFSGSMSHITDRTEEDGLESD